MAAKTWAAETWAAENMGDRKHGCGNGNVRLSPIAHCFGMVSQVMPLNEASVKDTLEQRSSKMLGARPRDQLR